MPRAEVRRLGTVDYLFQLLLTKLPAWASHGLCNGWRSPQPQKQRPVVVKCLLKFCPGLLSL